MIHQLPEVSRLQKWVQDNVLMISWNRLSHIKGDFILILNF